MALVSPYRLTWPCQTQFCRLGYYVGGDVSPSSFPSYTLSNAALWKTFIAYQEYNRGGSDFGIVKYTPISKERYIHLENSWQTNIEKTGPDWVYNSAYEVPLKRISLSYRLHCYKASICF